MKRNIRRFSMWTWATLALAAMAFAAVQDPKLPDGDGKKVLETACTSCHGLDGVVRLHLDKAGWEGVVSSMVSNGAQVDSKDFPVLVDYLVKNFGNAPAAQSGGGNSAAGKKILEDSCTTCHDLDLVSSQHLSKDDWQNVVNSMVAKGASLSDKDAGVLVEYLTATYGK
jgi:cytochrome c5